MRPHQDQTELSTALENCDPLSSCKRWRGIWGPFHKDRHLKEYSSLNKKAFFSQTQISVAVLPKTLFPRPTGDNVQLASRGVESFYVFKIAVKDQKLILTCNMGLRARNTVSE